MSKVKFIRQIDERNTALRLIIVNFGINLSAKLSRLGKIQEYLSPPNLLSWTFLARNFVPMILSLYHGTTIHLKSTFDTIFDAITSRLCGSPSYVINVHILTSLPPFKDIISHSSHLIYIAGKSWIIVISSLLPLQSDFLWFLIIFRAPQKWFLETLNVFNFIPPAWHRTKQIDFFPQTNLNLLPCQTLMWSVILSISSYVTYGIRHMAWCHILPVTSFVHHLNLSTNVCQMSIAA